MTTKKLTVETKEGEMLIPNENDQPLFTNVYEKNNKEILRKLSNHTKSKIDFDNHQIIGCIPHHAMKNPPEEQENCSLVDCKYCNLKMWMSAKKMEFLKQKKERRAYCFDCIIKEARSISSGIRFDPVDFTTLN